jgi:hypothetical protein
MESDAEILRLIRAAFANCPRPEHFTNYTHCCECAEHDEVLRLRDLDTLSMDDVGNAGWDPICFVSPAGFAYYFPALARLALETPQSDSYGWYGPQLFFQLSCGVRQQERIDACNAEQRQAVVALLEHILETRAALADIYCCADDLLHTIEEWREPADRCCP